MTLRKRLTHQTCTENFEFDREQRRNTFAAMRKGGNGIFLRTLPFTCSSWTNPCSDPGEGDGVSTWCQSVWVTHHTILFPWSGLCTRCGFEPKARFQKLLNLETNIVAAAAEITGVVGELIQFSQHTMLSLSPWHLWYLHLFTLGQRTTSMIHALPRRKETKSHGQKNLSIWHWAGISAETFGSVVFWIGFLAVFSPHLVLWWLKEIRSHSTHPTGSEVYFAWTFAVSNVQILFSTVCTTLRISYVSVATFGSVAHTGNFRVKFTSVAKLGLFTLATFPSGTKTMH